MLLGFSFRDKAQKWLNNINLTGWDAIAQAFLTEYFPHYITNNLVHKLTALKKECDETLSEIKANPAEIKALVEMRSPRILKKVKCLPVCVVALNMFVSQSSNKCKEFFKVIKKGKDLTRTQQCEEAFKNLKKHLGSTPLLSKPIDKEILVLYLVV